MIKVYERRIKVSEVSHSPEEFNSLNVGSIVCVEDKEYLIIDIIRYFYNFLSEEIVLNLLIQEIDFSKDDLPEVRESLSYYNEDFTQIVSEKKIDKSVKNLDKDINNITVGSVFKASNQNLYKIVSINRIIFKDDSLFIHFSAAKIIPVSDDYIMKVKKESMRKNFTVHIEK